MKTGCPYCSQPPKLVDGTMVYPRRPDLAHKKFWLCQPCGAYVGCVVGTTEPKGRLANAELRLAKRLAHEAFDPTYKDRSMTKSQKRVAAVRAYAQLAKELGIPVEQCNIAQFDVETCRRTVEICKQHEELTKP